MKKYSLRKQTRLLRAFTVVEMAVTLLLTAIVFSLAFFSYRIVYKQFQHQRSSLAEQTDRMLLQHALRQDVIKSRAVRTTSEGFECMTDTLSVKYKVQDSILIRENIFGVQDTFGFNELSSTCLFENQEQKLPNKLVDQVKIRFTKTDRFYIIQAKKYYDACILIENTN